MNQSDAVIQTKSVCPVCLQVLAAVITEKDGFVYLEKRCDEHGFFSTLIWEDSLKSYLAWENKMPVRVEHAAQSKAEKGCPYDCGHCENHLQETCCMLLEITSRCNLYCPVCFADSREDKEQDDLPLEDIGRQLDFLQRAGGKFNIQLSGGEPTVREDMEEVVALVKKKKFPYVQLNTNGLRLAEEEGYAKKLKKAGLDAVFLQFDGVSDEVYQTLRGKPLWKQKQIAVVRAAEAGLGVVLVPTLVYGVNHHQIGDILRYALGHMPAVRGVHFQPVSLFGRYPKRLTDKPLTIPFLLRAIEQQTQGVIKREYFAGGGAESAYCSLLASIVIMENGEVFAAEKEKSACCEATIERSRKYVAKQWSASSDIYEVEQEQEDGNAFASLDAFLNRSRTHRLTISAMFFQDAYSLDLNRLKQCKVGVLAGEKIIPFCAYNLTALDGTALYRNNEAMK